MLRKFCRIKQHALMANTEPSVPVRTKFRLFISQPRPKLHNLYGCAPPTPPFLRLHLTVLHVLNIQWVGRNSLFCCYDLHQPFYFHSASWNMNNSSTYEKSVAPGWGRITEALRSSCAQKSFFEPSAQKTCVFSYDSWSRTSFSGIACELNDNRSEI